VASAVSYIILGLLFAYLAFLYAEETVWNPITIILSIVSSVDLGLGITQLYEQIKEKMDSK